MNRVLLAIFTTWAVITGSVCAAAQTPAQTGFGGGGSASPYSEVPSEQQFLRYYPERAMNLGVEGRASINCMVMDDGGVRDCSIVAESPMGYEFGDAAIKLAPLFKMKPKLADGKSSAGLRVTIPISFRLAEPSPGDDAVMTMHAYWAKQPTTQDLENVRPAGLSGGGSAILQCHIRQGINVPVGELGKLVDCKAVQTNGANTGRAALQLAPMFQMTVLLARAASLGSIVQFSLIWQPKR